MVTKKSARRLPVGEAPGPVRAGILEAAFSAFMARGFAGTSTLEIAPREIAARVEKAASAFLLAYPRPERHG